MNEHRKAPTHTTTRATPRRSPRSGPALCAIALLCALATSQAGRAGPLGLFGPSGDDKAQQRQTVQDEGAAMLQELYAAKPELQAQIAKAAGYATFKKTDMKLFLVASGNGYGMLVNNQTGQKTYMRVASLGGGVGIGVSDLRVIFVFNDPSVMQTFVTEGWQFGGDADASAQYQNVGASAGQSVNANPNFQDGTVAGTGSTNVGAGGGNGNTTGQNVAVGGPMQIYQFTASGIALSATVSGTKYWVDSDLNGN